MGVSRESGVDGRGRRTRALCAPCHPFATSRRLADGATRLAGVDRCCAPSATRSSWLPHARNARVGRLVWHTRRGVDGDYVGRLWIGGVAADSCSRCDGLSGLFLPCEEHEKTFRLGQHEAAQILTFVSLSRNWQLLWLPKQGGSAKVVLLLDWLGKQYPGPIPRICLVLKRE